MKHNYSAYQLCEHVHVATKLHSLYMYMVASVSYVLYLHSTYTIMYLEGAQWRGKELLLEILA